MFAGTPDGGCIWPDFLPAYDAAVTLVKLLDLLAAVDRPLSHGGRGAAGDPRGARDHRHAVGAQGHGDARDRRTAPSTREIELIDGVKVIDDDRWALVLPDPDEALTHVWAEAGSDVEARRSPRSTCSASARSCVSPRASRGSRAQVTVNFEMVAWAR